MYHVSEFAHTHPRLYCHRDLANLVAGIVVGKFGAAVATVDEVESVYASKGES